MTEASHRFRPGDRVRVRMADPPGHIRTPFFIRGKTGWVEHIHGDFLNPESLGHGGDGLPKKTLYHVGFNQTDVWSNFKEAALDKVFVDIYEHWLEPV